MARVQVLRSRAVVLAVALAGLVVFVGGIGLASACKLALDCHLRDDDGQLGRTAGEMVVPPGFRATTLAAGLRQPTAFDFLPDGRIVVAEREGVVRLAENGRLVDKPVVDLRDQVNTAFFRGLIAVAVDPAFEANRFFYLVYSLKQLGRDAESPTIVRVSRFSMVGGSGRKERVIIGADGEGAESCRALPKSADCLPADLDHIGADIAFGEDGTLFIATGDGAGRERLEQAAFRAQDLDSLAGKILRVARDGRGLPSNPFFTGDPAANRSKVWALGLRNPFRLTLAPRARLPVVGDVGWNVAEEIDLAPAGANLGWPCFEGRVRTPSYKTSPKCAAFYLRDDEPSAPWLTLLHPDAKSVTGGVFYNGRAFPQRYRGSYFYADWLRGWIRHVRIDAETGAPIGAPMDFAENAGGPVALRNGPDGSLHVLSLNFGRIERIDYEGS